MQEKSNSGSTLVIDRISKSYGATVAVESASFALAGGEVHALLGENGAGKSTLVKILCGVAQPDSGEMHLNGRPYAPRSIMGARHLGVATAFQELSLLPNLSVAENLMLPKLPRGLGGLTSDAATKRAADEILERYNLSQIRSDTQLNTLSLADRQRLEIVRALNNAHHVLLLDEPTAALSQTEWLFNHVRAATAKGTAVLYISHRLGEVRELSARATVLRNGRNIATVKLDDTTDGDIFQMMVGRKVQTRLRPAYAAARGSRPILSIEKLAKGNLKNVSFDLGPGEIIGIAALEGQGQRELFRVLAGLEQAESGTISVDGQETKIKDPNKALKTGCGIAYLPEERKTEGILSGLTTASNIVLPILPKVANLSMVSRRNERKAALDVSGMIDLNPHYLSFAIGNLSGGNQQKALIARVLATGAQILLLFDPTRGVDVGTKQSIYSAISAFANSGGSVLFYSSELPEISQLAHRCLVIYGGKIFAEFSGENIDEQNMVSALIGHSSDVQDTVAGGGTS